MQLHLKIEKTICAKTKLHLKKHLKSAKHLKKRTQLQLMKHNYIKLKWGRWEVEPVGNRHH